MMRILFIAPSYYSHVGDIEYVIKSVAERLAKTGREAIIAAGEPSIDGALKAVRDGSQVILWHCKGFDNVLKLPDTRFALWVRVL
jgi:hypothetical protein